MSFITLDFETYYSKDFGLNKLTTEEYIRSDSFEVIGVSVKVDDAPAEWFSGSHGAIKTYLEQFDWANSALLAHNTMFDGAILAWQYGIVPAMYFDTLCMARALHGVDVGGSLASLVKRYELGEKGTEVINALGKRRADFNEADLARYGDYCKNDTELTYKLFCVLSTQFPESEFELIDMTLRMYTEPVLRIDDALLIARLEEIKQEKQELLTGLREKLGCETEEDVRKKLASNPQFAEVLRKLGVEPPKKISPATGKETYAFAKNDEGFIALSESEDPEVQQICAVRLGTKSTIEESRIERFIDVGARNKGLLPIPLKYYGAHTGRWAGSEAINLQNIPTRDKKKKALKNALIAPPGHLIINSDSSQIEARVLAWLAGQKDVVQQFRDNQDVYSIFASKIYKKEISKANPVERFVGKTCVGIGSLVLSERGWVPIEQIRLSDRVWDGTDWVCHSGVVLNGTKETLQISGLWLTPDHEVWSGTWQRADFLQRDEDTLSRALDIAAENLPSQAIWSASEGFARSLFDATAVQTNTQLTTITSKILSLLDVIYAPSKRLVKSVIGNTQKLCQKTTIELGSLIVSRLQSLVATPQAQINLHITGDEESVFLQVGGEIEQPSYSMLKPSQVGTTQASKWTGLTTTKDMNRGISDLSPVFKTCTTGEKWRTLRPVYDILNCGSRNRFTVLTNDGPLLVHNCVLGLGFGTGALKLRHTLKTQPPGADLSEDECKRIVSIYRETNYRITELWRECELALDALIQGVENEYSLVENKPVYVTKAGIRLPNGFNISYPKLRFDDDAKVYESRKGQINVWGGYVVENIVQALARIIVAEQMLRIREAGYRVVLTVHDAAVCVVHKSEADKAVTDIKGIMSKPPSWCQDLPVACEVKYGESYGEC
jgi:DNA polymerase I-like protein with 3'-5' exonuclease and polymerase domains